MARADWPTSRTEYFRASFAVITTGINGQRPIAGMFPGAQELRNRVPDAGKSHNEIFLIHWYPFDYQPYRDQDVAPSVHESRNDVSSALGYKVIILPSRQAHAVTPIL